LDGDAIAALCATFFADHLRAVGLEITGTPAHPHGHGHGHDAAAAAPSLGPNVVSVGVVQVGVWLHLRPWRPACMECCGCRVYGVVVCT
jgi:hypothetical protein